MRLSSIASLRNALGCAVACASITGAACGLSAIGTGAAGDDSGAGPISADTNDASGMSMKLADGAVLPADAPASAIDGSAIDGAPIDAAAFDAGPIVPKCPQTTSSAFALSSFVLAGTTKVTGTTLTLTPITNNQAGAAWYGSAFMATPTTIAVTLGFDEPDPNGAVDGAFTVAFLSSGNPPGAVPKVGNAGTSGGVCGLSEPGFAVVVDVTRAANGTNGDSLRIIDIATCNPVTGASNKDTSGYLGNQSYPLTITWTNPTTVSASINGTTVSGTVTTPSPMYMGVTAATGTQPSAWTFYGMKGTFAGCP